MKGLTAVLAILVIIGGSTPGALAGNMGHSGSSSSMGGMHSAQEKGAMPGSMQQTPSSGDHGTAMQGTGDHGTMEGTGDHGAMEGMGNMATFHHTGVAEGIRAEFQIMTLASMNTTDPGGATHHVMVRFFDQDTGDQVMGVAGRVKIVSPSKEESMADLKDYSGVMAANFMATEPGQYGIICLFRQDGKNRVVKFWYPMEK